MRVALEGGVLLSVYLLLYLSTTFVNKYVLSVLSFKYPTIFQGWQTLVGAITLRVLAVSGLVELNISDISRYRSNVAPWLPAMMLYVVSIYAGSKALSKLPVPVFMTLSSLSRVSAATRDIVFKKQLTSIWRYLLLMLMLVSSVMMGWSDPQFDSDGYHWMAVYLISTGLRSIYANFKSLVNLSDVDKLFSNYLYSVVMLAPSSYFLGDVLAAKRFPFWYFYRFYIGCILSGVFGVSLSLCAIRLRKNGGTRVFSMEQIQAGSKILTTLVSFYLFNIVNTASLVGWILVNHVAMYLESELMISEALENNQQRQRPTAEDPPVHKQDMPNISNHSVSEAGLDSEEVLHMPVRD